MFQFLCETKNFASSLKRFCEKYKKYLHISKIILIFAVQ